MLVGVEDDLCAHLHCTPGDPESAPGVREEARVLDVERAAEPFVIGRRGDRAHRSREEVLRAPRHHRVQTSRRSADSAKACGVGRVGLMGQRPMPTW